MPWRNGRGVTTELFREPAGEGDFDWRISLAGVDEDGAFSLFPGIDRHLVVVDGAGLRLRFDDGGEELAAGWLAPIFWDGGRGSSAELIDGPIRDFGVMTRRGVCDAEVRVRRTTGEARLRGENAFVHVLSGTARVSAGKAAWQSVDAGESAIVEGSSLRTVQGPGAALVLVTLHL